MLEFFLKLTSDKKKLWIISLIIFSFFAAYYIVLLYCRIETDVQAHLIVSYKFINEGGPLTPNFLYFILVALLAGFSKYKVLYYISSVLLIAAALTAKFLLNYKYTQECVTENKISRNRILLFSFGLLFIFCLPGVEFFKDKDFFLGLLAPNVWHNSTVIFLFPFAIALFFESYFFLINPAPVEKRRLLVLCALIFLNLLIKPSFLFTVVPTVFLFVLFEKLWQKKWVSIFIYGGGFLLIVLQYYIIYKLKDPAVCNDCSETVIIAPFAVWKHYTSNIPISFIASFLFPVTFFILSGGEVFKNKLVRFAAINWVIGLLIYILFAESGERKFHGNFAWQMITGNYLLFFVLGLCLWDKTIMEKIGKVPSKILQVLFYLHIFWGFGYFLKILLFKHYA